MKNFDNIFFKVALLIHIGLLVWAVEILWIPGFGGKWELNLLQRIIDLLTVGSFGVMLFLLPISLVPWYLDWSYARNMINRVMVWLFKAIFIVYIAPISDLWPSHKEES